MSVLIFFLIRRSRINVRTHALRVCTLSAWRDWVPAQNVLPFKDILMAWRNERLLKNALPFKDILLGMAGQAPAYP